MKVPRKVDASLGLAYIAVCVVVVLVAVLVYNKAFTSRDELTLRAGSVGNQIQQGSDVDLHGVPVGEVTSIEAVPGGARLTLELNPGTLQQLPVGTVARLLPKTLFGERYVALRPPQEFVSSPESLRPGDTIHQDSSRQAIELQQVFSKTLPLLKSISPGKLAASLGELAAMLRDRGDQLGTVMADWAAYLRKLNPHVPAMTDDIARFADVAEEYNVSAPDLLSALDAMTTTSRTVADRATDLRTVFANVITSADTTRGFVARNQGTIEILSAQSRKALAAVRPYASEFPCVLKAARKFIPVMDKTLGKGTGEPGMHVRLQIVPSRGKYVPGKDSPVYLSGKQPRCPYVTGQTGTRAARTATGASGSAAGTPATIPPPPTALISNAIMASTGLGQANSPAENQMIAELVAPTVHLAPSAYPAWGSLLVGPLLRNSKVVLK